MKVKLEYVWLDGHTPEPNLRSKIKIIDGSLLPSNILEFGGDLKWGFDGSSTKQAEGYSSDCYLTPIRSYRPKRTSILSKEMVTIYLLCEVYDKDGNPHESNQRNNLGDEDTDFWVGFEQEYFIRDIHSRKVLGFSNPNPPEPQGKYYCGVGGHILGRDISEKHMEECLNFGIDIEGTNAEVALGQWEFQIFNKGKLKSADDLWMARYFLHKLGEIYKYEIEFHPKPLGQLNWNGSGLHTNFSNSKMRENGGEEYFKSIFEVFEQRKDIHMLNYGSDNHLRLTGEFETQSIDKFSWGVSDRGASIRVPKSVGETWQGYLEDRRPGSNADPYKILKVITESLNLIK